MADLVDDMASLPAALPNRRSTAASSISSPMVEVPWALTYWMSLGCSPARFSAMRNALRDAKLGPEAIDYINAHGTSTPKGDEIELTAVKRLFGQSAYKLSMSSTKSAIGHLLGAAGAVEAIYSTMALVNGIVPPTLNLADPSEGCDIDLVPHKPKQRPVKYALSNSFGFGGTNAALVLGRAP